MLRWMLVVLASVSPAAPAAAQQAHEHGVAALNATVDGARLVLELESPLDSLVGFEHEPRTDAQRAALARMEETLKAADRLFKPSEAAGCAARAARVEQRRHDAKHAEVHATYEWACATPGALDRVEVRLFEAFSRLKRVKAQKATPRGQGAATLTPRARTLSL